MTPKKRGAAPAPPVPHVRIADRFYELLQYLSPFEVKLWLALRLRAWRKDGKQKGRVGKSLRRIAKEINMPWSSCHKAMRGLEVKGLAIQRPNGIYLPTDNGSDPPLFDTGVDTPFEIKPGRRKEIESGHTVTRGGHTVTKVVTTGPKWSQGDHLHSISTPSFKRLSAGRSVYRDVYRDGAKKDDPGTPLGGCPGSFHLTEGGRDDMRQDKETLAVEPLTRKRIRELIGNLKRAADDASKKQQSESAPHTKWHEDQEAQESKRRTELEIQKRKVLEDNNYETETMSED